MEVSPGPRSGTVKTAQGDILAVPAGWTLLPPGDAGLTRRLKKAGPSWTVKERRGRRVFSLGVWAPAEHIESAQAALTEERADPSHARKLEAGRRRRAEAQAQYAEDFEAEILRFLAFDARYAGLAGRLAKAICDHAVPVGSGTVARTQRIPVERRAEAATIAWLRHATTAYDQMHIPRGKGMRREVRRLLASHSRALLDRYRRGESMVGSACPLHKALGAEVTD